MYSIPTENQLSPAVPLGSSALNDGLDEDAQFLQACVSTNAHPNNTDPEAVVIWKYTNPDWQLKCICSLD